jgi:hypothetical protein
MNGKKYWYNTPNDGRREIGVHEIERGVLYAVCYHDSAGVQMRVNTSNLPASDNPGVVQRGLDEFARRRGLEEAGAVMQLGLGLPNPLNTLTP